jgi:hypothetical protein
MILPELELRSRLRADRVRTREIRFNPHLWDRQRYSVAGAERLPPLTSMGNAAPLSEIAIRYR